MNPVRLPVARELFAQWQRLRGGRVEPAARPFSRGWEELLEEAGLVGGIERAEAERDARALAADGWLQLKTVPYKPHLIARVAIPRAAEERWGAAFGFVAPSDEEARRLRAFDWHPKLAFVREARLNVPLEDLERLHRFLAADDGARDVVPVKERSLEIFGDEKRLDALLASALFQPGRLEVVRDLRCDGVGEPLAWRRGPIEAASGPILVLENAATWHSYGRWNAARPQFSAVVYGAGNRFVDGARSLPDLFAELGGPRPILYFGDLDPPGLAIPQRASACARALGLPAVEPHLWSYRQLLALGEGRSQPWEGESPDATLCDWLGELAGPARRLFEAQTRLAQEWVGWEFLRDRPAG